MNINDIVEVTANESWLGVTGRVVTTKTINGILLARIKSEGSDRELEFEQSVLSVIGKHVFI